MSSSRKVSLLIIDPNRITVECYRKQIQMHFPGVAVDTADTLQEGLALLAGRKEDIVIGDLPSPEIERQMAARVKSEAPNAYIILITGSSACDLTNFDYDRRNVEVVLCKPINADDLIKEVSKAIDARE